MSKIAVKCDKPVKALLVRVCNPSLVSASDSLLTVAMYHRQALVRGGELIQNRARSIGRIVIEKEELGAEWQREQLRDHVAHIVALVVRRNKDELPDRHA